MKCAFHPLLGDMIFGWVGDAIDAVSALTSVVGVCTTLGLGALYLSTGLHRLNHNIPDDRTTQVQTRPSIALQVADLTCSELHICTVTVLLTLLCAPQVIIIWVCDTIHPA
jgi:choline-glycine betaine transporter